MPGDPLAGESRSRGRRPAAETRRRQCRSRRPRALRQPARAASFRKGAERVGTALVSLDRPHAPRTSATGFPRAPRARRRSETAVPRRRRSFGAGRVSSPCRSGLAVTARGAHLADDVRAQAKMLTSAPAAEHGPVFRASAVTDYGPWGEVERDPLRPCAAPPRPASREMVNVPHLTQFDRRRPEPSPVASASTRAATGRIEQAHLTAVVLN